MKNLNLNIFSDFIEWLGESIFWLFKTLWSGIVWLFKDVIGTFLKWVADGFVLVVTNYPVTTVLIIICVILIVCRLWHAFIKK